MKAISRPQNQCARVKISVNNQRSYWIAICLASLACGGGAMAQTNNPSTIAAPAGSASSTNVTKLQEMTVFGQLEAGRNQIMPDLGATTHTITKEQIAAQAQGADAPFSELLYRFPGAAEDG